MKKLRAVFGIVLLSVMTISCETLQNLPTNTTGNVFSLNGQWKLTSTTDATAMVGSVIQVYPIVGNATIRTIANNTYCVRESDEFWKTIKRAESGGFTVSTLSSACTGSPVYNSGTISVVNNDEIVVTTRTSENVELIQRWTRVKTS